METGKSNRIKKIVITGPESTGKTQLTQELSNRFKTVYVPEYARTYIEGLSRKYTFEDVEIIARKQLELEQELEKESNRVLFYDTFLIITKIWFELCYNSCPEWLLIAMEKMQIDLFLVCQTDLPWIPDSVRENGGEMRNILRDKYIEEIANRGFLYEMVEGEGKDRLKSAMRILERYNICP